MKYLCNRLYSKAVSYALHSWFWVFSVKETSMDDSCNQPWKMYQISSRIWAVIHLNLVGLPYRLRGHHFTVVQLMWPSQHKVSSTTAQNLLKCKLHISFTIYNCDILVVPAAGNLKVQQMLWRGREFHENTSCFKGYIDDGDWQTCIKEMRDNNIDHYF